MDLNGMVEYLKANPQLLVGIGVIAIIVFLIFYFWGGKKDQVKEQLLKEMQPDWGRKEVAKHTKEDLDKLNKTYFKLNKKIYRGSIGNEVKIGNGTLYQNLVVEEVKDEKGNKIDNPDKSKHYIIRFENPFLDLELPFPLSIIFQDLLGSHDYMLISEKNILFENKKQINLNVTEFTQVYDVFMPVEDLMFKKPKMDQFVFHANHEELQGRLNNLPAKTAQINLLHTQELAMTEKKAEVLAKTLNQNNPPVRQI